MSKIVRSASMIVTTALALSACSGSGLASDSGQDAPKGYTPIYALTDCGDLQTEATRFYAKSDEFFAVDDLTNSGLAAYFAAAAEERMVSLGCYN